MDPSPDSNGRATIREVHALLTEQRQETRGHLDNMEERIVRALHGTEDRIVSSIAGLDKRVSALEEWREDENRAHEVARARHEGMAWLPRNAFLFVERHSTTVIALALAGLALVGAFLSIDLIRG